MILYNMRYRGPMEYDKFVLNAFQFHNEVHDVLLKQFGESQSVGAFIEIIEKVNESYSYYVGRKASDNQAEVIGLSEQLYLKLLESVEV